MKNNFNYDEKEIKKILDEINEAKSKKVLFSNDCQEENKIDESQDEIFKDNKDEKIVTELEKKNEQLHYMMDKAYLPMVLFTAACLKNKTDEEMDKICELLNGDKNEFKKILKTIIYDYHALIDNIDIFAVEVFETKNDYKVGYKKPPLETRFQKGNKGNKKGRKNKKDANILEMLSDALKTRVTVKINGQKRRIYKKEAIVQKMISQLINGERVPMNNTDIIKLLDRIEYFNRNNYDSQ